MCVFTNACRCLQVNWQNDPWIKKIFLCVDLQVVAIETKVGGGGVLQSDWLVNLRSKLAFFF